MLENSVSKSQEISCSFNLLRNATDATDSADSMDSADSDFNPPLN